MKFFKLFIFLIFTTNNVWAKDSSSDEISPKALGISVGIVDDLAQINFEPYKILLLMESSPGVVKQFRSWYINSDSNKKSLLVGSAVNFSLNNDNLYRYTFFLASRDGDFTATPVREVTANEIKERSITIADLKKETALLEKKSKEIENQINDAEDRLSFLKTQASEIANLDELAELKMRLFGLQMAEDKKSEEKNHLKELLDKNAYSAQDGNIDNIRFILSQQLRDIVILTRGLSTDNNSKEVEIRRNLTKKLNLVQQNSNINPEELRHAIEKLKIRRANLEKELKIN